MAVLTRPRFHAQERLDLEDFNQILSGLRTDSRLWTRQFISNQNYILKGFEVSGLDGATLSVEVFDGTFVLAGREIDINGDVLESAGDFSFYTLESSVGPNSPDARISTDITGGNRATVDGVVRRLYIYLELTTEEGTPITKAFWDPSANGGQGAEFNQRVNTAVDLAVNIQISTGPQDDLSLIELAQVVVDSGGTILSITDSRPLLFQLREDFVFDSGSEISLRANTAANLTLPDIGGTVFSNTDEFILGEQVYFIPNSLVDPVITGERLRATITTNPGTGDQVELQLDNLALPPSDITGDNPLDRLEEITARTTTVVGVESGAVRIIERVSHNFSRNDKSIDNVKEMFDSLATEIKRLKGTPFWYSDPGASVLDVLRFINSTIVSESDTGRYSFSGGLLTISDDTGVCFLDNAFTPGMESPDDEPTQSECTANGRFWEQGGLNSNDIATVRVFGQDAKFFLTRQDTAADNTLPGFNENGGILIEDDEVLYITLPDLNDISFDDTIDYQYSGVIRFRDVDPVVPGNRDTYNADNPIFGELNNPNAANNFIGRYKVVPITDYVHDDRNYWIAFRETGNSIHIRGIGVIGQDELVPISSGVTNQTLSYIGAPNENTAIPSYSSFTAITDHRDDVNVDGAYLVPDVPITVPITPDSNDFNEPIIESDDNLTEAVDELNEHTTSLKDTQYQNLGVKLIAGGFWTWNLSDIDTSGSLDNAEVAYLQVPGITNERNTIPPGTIISLEDGEIAFVDINRIDAGSTDVVLGTSTVDEFIPARDRFVIARRVGGSVYAGTFGTTRLNDGECSHLDGELQFFGFDTTGGVPRQLKISPLGNQRVSVSSSDVTFNTGKDSEPTTLALSIGVGLLSFEGAVLDFSGVGATFGSEVFPDDVGKILDAAGTATFRGETAANSQFSLATLADGSAAWYSININEGEAIDDPANPNAGRILGTLDIARGSATAFTGIVPFAEFTGTVPVGQVRITRGDGVIEDDSLDPAAAPAAGTLFGLNDNDIIQLGASGGGGGGGTGNANQDLNNYVNRLNLSIFEFMTPVIAAVAEQRDLADEVNSTTGLQIGSDGFGILAGTELITDDLLDPEFIEEEEPLTTVEVIGTWVTEEGTQRIDPNAQWFITRDTNQVSPNLPLTEAFTGIISTINDTEETFTVFNHGLSTGHKINFSDVGSLVIQNPDGSAANILSTNFYVNVVDLDNICLHLTVDEAEAGLDSTRILVSGTPDGATITRAAGIIPRIGETDTVRAVFEFTDTVAIADQVVKIRVLGDADASPDNGLLSSIGLLYRDEVAETGVNFRSIDDVNEVLRSNHLHNEFDTSASYGVAGRGIQLFDTGDVAKEIALQDDALTLDSEVLVPAIPTVVEETQYALQVPAAGDPTWEEISPTLFQRKEITTNFATGSADVTDLQFNNLIVGRTYRLSGAMGFGTGSTGAFDAFVLFRSATGGAGSSYGRTGVFNQGGQSTGASISPNIIFTAISTTIVPRTSFDNAGRIVADASAPTFLTLEELPTHTATTQWT